MTSYGLDEWFWAMFEPTPTWPNFDFGQLCLWIGQIGGSLEKKSQSGAKNLIRFYKLLWTM